MTDRLHSELASWGAQQLRRTEAPWVDDTLPWRRESTPYRVFLAEFLLVRTRTDVVARLYEDILAQYPDIPTLDEADEQKLADTLEPLGLKKRVPLLKRAARYLIEEHQGEIPTNRQELKKIPGIGQYTAAAIAAFAFGSSDVPADVNILRFLSRLTGLPMKHITKGSTELKELLPYLSRERDGPEPDVLLDFCRLICRPGTPKCEECPLKERCAYLLEVMHES